MRGVSQSILWIAGVVVVVAGALHLTMTAHLMRWFATVTIGPDADVARSAMQLNHLMVGVLLLALGSGLAAIARPLAQREPWAMAVGIADGVALLAVPLVLAISVRGPMLDAPVFVAAAMMLTVAAFVVAAAVLYLCLARSTRA